MSRQTILKKRCDMPIYQFDTGGDVKGFMKNLREQKRWLERVIAEPGEHDEAEGILNFYDLIQDIVDPDGCPMCGGDPDDCGWAEDAVCKVYAAELAADPDLPCLE